MKKIFGSIILGVAVFCFSNNASAASFDNLKKDVEENGAVVFNPISEKIMTNESSIEYVKVLEEEQKNEGLEEVTDEIMDEAFEQTKELSTLPPEKDSLNIPLIQPRGTSIPTRLTYIDRIPGQYYASNPFSGRGWRYSETKFAFANVAANPYFAVKAVVDSFYLYTTAQRFTIPAFGNALYYPARSSNVSGYTAYFSTLDPINGARYHIY